MKKYAAYKDSRIEWLGEIPEQWNCRKLKYLSHLQSGENIVSEDIFEEGEYKVYGGNGLRGFCNDYTHEGDFILIGRQGAHCGNIHYAIGKFWASEHAVVTTPKSKYATKYLGEVLKAMDLNQYSLSAAQPGISVDGIVHLSVSG